MGAYSILLKESVKKDIEGIPRKDLQRIMERIGALSDDPRPVGCEKLTAQERYRIRQGKYRIVYSVEDGELIVWVVKVGHRRDVYR